MVSLLLVGLAVLAALNINIILSFIENKNEVMVYTEGDLTPIEIAEISETLMKSAYVSAGGVRFYSKEDAWDDWQNNYPDYYTIYGNMDYNPMPNTHIVTVNDLTMISSAVNEFRGVEGVIKVSAPYDFAEFLIGVRTTLTVIGSAVILALIIVSLVIIYNTSRASVFSRRQEINIMKYVGATNAFVKIPFFIEGMFIGVIAGAVSWILTKLAYESVMTVFSGDMTLWQALEFSNLIEFNEVIWYVLAANCTAGAVLSAAGIIMSMGKHLRV